MFSEIEIKGVGRYWVEDCGAISGNSQCGWQAVFGDSLTIPYVLNGQYTGAIINALDTEFYIETINIHGFPLILRTSRWCLDAAAKALSQALGPREDVWIKGYGLNKARYSSGTRCSSVDYYRYFVFDENGRCNNIFYNDTTIPDSISMEPF